MTNEELLLAIVGAEKTNNFKALEKYIYLAEDTNFTVEQNERLGPILIEIAKKYIDIIDHEYKPILWSAIRTGSSMLNAERAAMLVPLFATNKEIKDRIVAVKMVGRIFEVHPPKTLDSNILLSSNVYFSIEPIIYKLSFIENLPSEAFITSIAFVDLGVYALAAMGSLDLKISIKRIADLKSSFINQLITKSLCNLKKEWHPNVSTMLHKNLDESMKGLA